jgi:hypothetical protein
VPKGACLFLCPKRCHTQYLGRLQGRKRVDIDSLPTHIRRSYHAAMARSEAADEDKPIPTKRRTCTLAVVTIERLEKLKRRGTHGTTIAAVMTSLIESGVRQAMTEGFLPMPEKE